MMDWYQSGSRSVENLLSMSVHVASDIQVFFLASLAFGFGITLHMAEKIPYFLVGWLMGQRGRHMQLPRYSLSSFRGVLRRQPRTM